MLEKEYPWGFEQVLYCPSSIPSLHTIASCNVNNFLHPCIWSNWTLSQYARCYIGLSNTTIPRHASLWAHWILGNGQALYSREVHSDGYGPRWEVSPPSHRETKRNPSIWPKQLRIPMVRSPVAPSDRAWERELSGSYSLISESAETTTLGASHQLPLLISH